MTSRIVYLLRHAQVDAAYADKCRGVTDCELSDTGRLTSQRNAAYLRRQNVELVVTSGRRRTDYIGQLLTAHGIAHVVDPSFRERDFGTWEGLSWREISERFPSEHAQWERYEPVIIPGGETQAELEARAVASWQRLLSFSFTCAAVVSHGAFNFALLWYLLRGWTSGKRPRQQHGCLNEIHIIDGESRIARMNILINKVET